MTQPSPRATPLARAGHLSAMALAVLCAYGPARAQPLPERPASLVPAESLAKAQRDLDAANKALEASKAEVARLKQAAAQTAKPDPEAAARLQQAQGELKAARERISTLEEQLKQAQAQLAEAKREAQVARKNPGASVDEASLRSERDSLKRQLASATRDKDRLQDELNTAQQALQQAQQKAQAAATKPAVVSPPVSVAEPPPPKPSLQDKQEIKLAGCGDKCPTFIVLPQVGSVTLGQGPGEQYLSPARSVNFGYRLLAAKTETTVAQWRHFMQQSGYKLPANNTTHCDWQKEAVSEQHPVRCISAEDADAYAHWLHTTYAPALPGKAQIRLPSEDEWEYAARATRWTEERQWDSGSNGGKENCTYAASNNCTGSNPDPVAKTGRKPNAWGLYDMIGNVWEWTATPGGSGRVVRGGSFYDNDDYLRLSARSTSTPGRRDYNYGVRVFARIDL